MYAGIIGLRKASAILVLALDDETSDLLDASAEHACKPKEVFVLDALRAACRRELAMANVGVPMTGVGAMIPTAAEGDRQQPAPVAQPKLFDGHDPAKTGRYFGRNRLGLPVGERAAVPREGERLWTVDEAAVAVGLGRSTIQREVARGNLAAHRPTPRVVLIPDHSLREFESGPRRLIRARRAQG